MATATIVVVVPIIVAAPVATNQLLDTALQESITTMYEEHDDILEELGNIDRGSLYK